MRVTRALSAAAALLLSLGAGRSLPAQGSDADEVARVIRAETESYYRRDVEAWKATWVQDSSAIRTFITSGSYSVALGWDRFGPGTIESMRRDSTPQVARVDRSNYVSTIDGSLAWAEYDERTITPADSVPLLARQNRTLVKRDGQWRILSAGSFVESTYGTFPGAVESRMERIGRDLMGAKRHRDALRVLGLNAALFPRSAAAQRSLGEAHAAVGETRSAIQSYEKSLAIDPNSAAARTALTKLRGQR